MDSLIEIKHKIDISPTTDISNLNTIYHIDMFILKIKKGALESAPFQDKCFKLRLKNHLPSLQKHHLGFGTYFLKYQKY